MIFIFLIVFLHDNRLAVDCASIEQAGISYNQPKLCPNASWNSNGITFANSTREGTNPADVFVNTNNTVHVIDAVSNFVQIWLDGESIPRKMISSNSMNLARIFITVSGDIFAASYDNGVTQWSATATYSMNVTYFSTSKCLGVFVDTNSSLYCSSPNQHRVFKQSLNVAGAPIIPLVGTGTAGTFDNQLKEPHGIFVTLNFSLYVAECGNNRIQLFQFGQSTGTTVAGAAKDGFSLSCPVHVVLDADDDLFIVDYDSGRIVRSGSGSTRCVAGCSGSPGSAANQLKAPYTMSFDSGGDIFVADRTSGRVQKFTLESNTCGETSSTSKPMTSSTTNPSTIEDIQTFAHTMSSIITTISDPTIINTIVSSTQDGTTTAQQLNSTPRIEIVTTSRQMDGITGIGIIATSQQMDSTTSTGIIASATTTTLITEFPLQNCWPPIVAINAHQVKLSRNQGFSLSVHTHINCSGQLSISTQWQAFVCHGDDQWCNHTFPLDSMIQSSSNNNSSDLTILPFTLPIGTYRFVCTVSMIATGLNGSDSTKIDIIPSLISITLLPGDTNTIILNHKQQLILRPNVSWKDSNNIHFEDMYFIYYCRLYPDFDYPSINETRLNIDDVRIDPDNPSCFNLSAMPSSFLYDNNTIRSLLTIKENALKINQTYEWHVAMVHGQDLIAKSSSIFIHVQPIDSFLIAISCVINMCSYVEDDYRLINPGTQIIVQSSCFAYCNEIHNALITWQVYQGSIKGSTMEWKKNDQITEYLLGVHSRKLTAMPDLFSTNPSILYWSLEVTYKSNSSFGFASIRFKINRPPSPGSCSISPPNSNTSSLYTIDCVNGTDLNGIQDYSLYALSSKIYNRIALAYSLEPTFTVHLPCGDSSSDYTLNLLVQVRDTLHAVSEMNISAIRIIPNERLIVNLMNSMDIDNAIEQLVLQSNQSSIFHTLTSVLNQMSSQDQETIIKNTHMVATTVLVTPLGVARLPVSINNNNSYISQDFIENLNKRSSVRKHLLDIYLKHSEPVGTINELILQATHYSQITAVTSELSRSTASLASYKCNQLAHHFESLFKEITLEEIQIAASQIAQCASNALTGITAPLHRRSIVLECDMNDSNQEAENDDIPFDALWSDPYFIPDKNELSMETIIKNRNLFYQKKAAEKIRTEADQTMSLLTKALRYHMNINQTISLVTSSLIMILNEVHQPSLINKSVDLLVPHAFIRFPSNVTINGSGSFSLRSILQPLPSYSDNSMMKDSTAVSLSILDELGNESDVRLSSQEPVELFIPRDSNLPIPLFKEEMNLNFSREYTNKQFFLFAFNITQSNSDLTHSIHLDFKPLNPSLVYALIFKFDSEPMYDSVNNQTDGWSMFCPEDLSKEKDFYSFFVDNTRTDGHKFIIFGIRELNDSEECSQKSSPPITDHPYIFSINYLLRVYLSSCYYLDHHGNWRTDGMKVGSKTNHLYTQCFSVHI